MNAKDFLDIINYSLIFIMLIGILSLILLRTKLRSIQRIPYSQLKTSLFGFIWIFFSSVGILNLVTDSNLVYLYISLNLLFTIALGFYLVILSISRYRKSYGTNYNLREEINRIKILVSEVHTYQALKRLENIPIEKDALNIILLIRSEVKMLKLDYLQGTISSTKRREEFNKINNKILEVIDLLVK